MAGKLIITPTIQSAFGQNMCSCKLKSFSPYRKKYLNEKKKMENLNWKTHISAGVVNVMETHADDDSCT